MQAAADGGLPTVLKVALVLAALVAVSLPILVYFGRRQRMAVRSFAAVQGWVYRDYDPDLAMRYAGDPFVVDRAAEAEAVISGRYFGIPFAAYAYTYQTTAQSPEGPVTPTHTVPVVALLMESGLPDLDVALADGQRQGSAAAGWMFDGVPIPISDEFDAAFAVRSLNPVFAHQVLTPRLTHDLLAYPKHAWSWRGGDLLSLGSWNGKPEKITVFLDHLGMVLRSVPDDVWYRFGGGERPAV